MKNIISILIVFVICFYDTAAQQPPQIIWQPPAAAGGGTEEFIRYTLLAVKSSLCINRPSYQGLRLVA